MKIEISPFNGVYNTMTHRIIDDDLYSISKRIRKIDPEYFILLNRISGKYEVHHMGQPPGETYCLTVPYDELDERTLKLVRETRIERLHELIEKMHADNDKIDRDKDTYFKDYTKWVNTEIYRYVCTHESKETIDDGAFKTRWV
jgi:hypothetical protein